MESGSTEQGRPRRERLPWWEPRPSRCCPPHPPARRSTQAWRRRTPVGIALPPPLLPTRRPPTDSPRACPARRCRLPPPGAGRRPRNAAAGAAVARRPPLACARRGARGPAGGATGNHRGGGPGGGVTLVGSVGRWGRRAARGGAISGRPAASPTQTCGNHRPYGKNSPRW